VGRTEIGSIMNECGRSVLIYKVLHTGTPAYLSEMISSYLPSRSLRSNRSSLLNVHRVIINAALPAFSNSAPIV